jgi:hypothetical protein
VSHPLYPCAFIWHYSIQMLRCALHDTSAGHFSTNPRCLAHDFGVLALSDKHPKIRVPSLLSVFPQRIPKSVSNPFYPCAFIWRYCHQMLRCALHDTSAGHSSPNPRRLAHDFGVLALSGKHPQIRVPSPLSVCPPKKTKSHHCFSTFTSPASLSPRQPRK